MCRVLVRKVRRSTIYAIKTNKPAKTRGRAQCLFTPDYFTSGLIVTGAWNFRRGVFRGQNLILWTEFNFVNKMLFRVMKPILSTKSKQSMTNTFCRRN